MLEFECLVPPCTISVCLAGADPDEEYLRACEKAMREKESLKLTTMNGVLSGLPRSGKSSLMTRLLGKFAEAITKSTGVAEEVVQVQIRRSTLCATVLINDLQWLYVDKLDDETLLLLKDIPHSTASTEQYVHEINVQEVHSRTGSSSDITSAEEPIQSDLKPSKEYSTMSSSTPLTTDIQMATPKDEPSPFEEGPLDVFRKCLQTGNWKELKSLMGEPWYLYLTDTGGQPEFQQLLPALVCGPSIFILVFPLYLRLNDKYPVEFVNQEGKTIRPYTSSYTVLESILESLASISSMETCVQGRDSKEVCTKSRVLLVGTFRDKVTDEDVHAIDEELQKAVKEHCKYSIIVPASEEQMIFAVDNTQPPDNEDILQIRKAFNRLGTNPSTREVYQVEIPCPWLIFGLMFRKLLLGQPIVPFDRCLSFGQTCRVDSATELKNCLWFLHRHVGIPQHFRSKKVPGLDKLVFRSPQFLFDMLSRVVSETFTFEGFQGEVKVRDDFIKRGIFSAEVFEKVAKTSSELLSPALLLGLLEHLHIIAPIQGESPTTSYFMPCALTHADAVDPAERDEDSPVQPLLLRFNCSYVPRGTFGALVAHLLQKERKPGGLLWKLDKDRIRRDQLTIQLTRKERVVLKGHSTYFSVKLLSPLTLDKDTDKQRLKRICNEVRLELINGIAEIAQVLRYVRNCTLIPCFICPEDRDAVEPHVANVKTDGFEWYLECSTEEFETFDISEEYSVWLSEVNS